MVDKSCGRKGKMCIVGFRNREFKFFFLRRNTIHDLWFMCHPCNLAIVLL